MKKYDISREDQKQHELLKFVKKWHNTVNRKNQRDEHLLHIKNLFPSALKVLCLGCRHESEVIQFRDFGYSAIGLDFAGTDNDFIKIGDAHELLSYFEENSFDIVYSSHSMEHMHDAELVLENIRKVATMGAFIVLPAKPLLGKSHCSVFDIMLESVSPGIPELSELKNSSLLEDFRKLKPYELKFFKYMDDRGPNYRYAADGCQYAEFGLAFEW